MNFFSYIIICYIVMKSMMRIDILYNSEYKIVENAQQQQKK